MANLLNGELVLRRSYDESEEALRVSMTSTQLAVALSHADGDSIETHPNSLTNSGTSEVIITGMKSVCLYLMPDGAGVAQAKVQVSPTDSGDIWVDVPTSTVTAHATLLSVGSVHATCARRARVVHVTGTPTTHLVAQAV